MRRLPALLALLLARAAAAQPGLEVRGEVLATVPRLEVRVTVANEGDRAAAPLELSGEFLGQRQSTVFSRGVAPGARASAVLEFEIEDASPGVHALPLLLEHPGEGAPDAAGNAPVVSRRAWLLVALGANPPPAVQIRPQAARILVQGSLRLDLSSADGEAHRVRVRAYTARGLRVPGEPPLLDVPARGAVGVSLPLMRAGAGRGTQHTLLLVAETEDGALVRTTVATAQVDVAPDGSWVRRFRRPLLIGGLLLLGGSLLVELVRRIRTRTHAAV